MANKITAPHSYDPGKGRPKEYLAYLNEREMAYLRSINGNNTERGPRGLPSFPPEDAVGSSSKAGSRGPGGPSGPNSGPSTGGGGKGPGGPSGPNSGPSGGNLGGGGKSAPGSSPSSPGGLRGAGGNYGSGSGKPGTTSSPGGYKGPSSPMGGQGPSFSRDTKAQQDAQVRDAIKAVKNSPAFRNDASSGGIRTLSVGPIGTPVNVGPRVTPTQNRASVVGGWGVQAFNSAMPKATSIVSPMTLASGPRREGALYAQRSLYGANKQIYDKLPVGKQFGELGEGYDERIPASLGTREYSPYGMNIPDVVKTPTKGISVSGGLGISALPSSGLPLSKTSFDGDEDYFNDFREGTSGIESLGDLYDANNTSIGVPGRETPKKDYVEGVDEPNNLPIGVNDVFGPFAPERRPTEPRDAEYGGFISPAAAATPDPEEKILEVENVPESAGMSFTPSLVPSKPTISRREQRLLDIQNQSLGLDQGPYKQPSQETADRLNKVFEQSGLRTPDATNMTTEEMVEALRPPAKTRSAAEAWKNTPYEEPGTPARRRGPVEKFLQEKFPHWGVRGAAKGYGYVEDRRIAGMTPDERIAEMDRRAQMDRSRFKGSDGREDGIGSGGKNEPPRIEQAEKEATKPKPKPKEDGRRPAIYYKWDLGVGVPSPTDSDYTLYLKYLQEKAAAKAGMAR